MTPTLPLSEMAGLWLGAFLSLCIFSFLYRDNAFYKLAEHVFVGVSAGYWMCIGFWQVLYPNLWLKLQAGDWRYAFAGLLGLMLLLRLVPRVAWVGRWPLAFMVGIFAGFNIVYTMQAQVLKQIEATLVPLWGNPDLSTTLIHWIVVVGVLTGLLYFYFSVEHRGPVFGAAAQVGIWVLMIAFGAAFGYTIMARVSLLIGRVMYFQDIWARTLDWFRG